MARQASASDDGVSTLAIGITQAINEDFLKELTGHRGKTLTDYTLLQKKRNFSEPIFPGDPGLLTLTPGHVHFVKWF